VSRTIKEALCLSALCVTFTWGGSGQESPFLPPTPYIEDLELRLTPLVAPLCEPWLPGGSAQEQLCFAFPLQSGLVWVVPDPDERPCQTPSAWATLSSPIVMRAQRCGSRVHWGSWGHALLSFETLFVDAVEGMRNQIALGRSQLELQELMEPLAPGLFWVNRLIPFFEWHCGSWGPWRPLPLLLGQVRTRTCQREEGDLWWQWEAQA